jgi:hypothetical protein
MAGAPVVSMVTLADVGGVDENQNATGLAHIFEHMAFKGTTTIGTKDLAKEAEAMKREDEAFLALRASDCASRSRTGQAKEVEAAFNAAKEEAAEKWMSVGSASCSSRRARRG